MFRAFWEDLALLFTTISGDLGWANITPSSDPKSSKQLIQTCCPSTAPAKSADVFLLKGNIWENIRCLAYHSFSHGSSKILNEAHRFSELTLILNHSGPYPRLPWEPCFWRYLTPKTYPKDLQSQQVIWDILIKPSNWWIEAGSNATCFVVFWRYLGYINKNTLEVQDY